MIVKLTSINAIEILAASAALLQEPSNVCTAYARHWFAFCRRRIPRRKLSADCWADVDSPYGCPPAAGLGASAPRLLNERLGSARECK